MIRALLIPAILAGALTNLATGAPMVSPAEIEATQRASARFSNQSTGSTATAYSGQVSPSAAAPSDGVVFLQRSAMGQPLASDHTPEGHVPSVLEDVRRRLYYEFADETGEFGKDSAAFRYKVLMYGPNEPGEPIRARFEQFGQWYGDDERARALEAERILRNALVGSPFDSGLQGALLELYADRAIAEVQFVKQRLDALNRLQLGLDGTSPASDSVQQEIAVWTGAGGIVPSYRSIIGTWGELFNDPYGVNVSMVDPTVPAGMPFGFVLFRERTPQRDAFAAQYVKETGEIEFVPAAGNALPDYPRLHQGYRELVLMLNLLADYAEALSEASRLHALVIDFDDPNDPLRTSAYELVAEGQQQVYVDGTLLLGLFPEISPSSLQNSGLGAAIDRWQYSLKQLADTRQIIQGERNPLGFQPDFLVLATGLQGGDGGFLDSYNALASWMTELTDPPTRPLAVAVAEFNRARNRYATYQGYEDQLATEFNTLRQSYNSRAFELVGATPDDPGYNPGNPEFGEIAEQWVSIELAQNKIEQNRQAIENVNASIEIEIERRAQEAQINADIGDVMIRWGEDRATLREEIGHWRATQAGAEAANNTLNNAFSAVALGPGAVVASVIFGVANGAVQVGGELAISKREADLERYAALEQAEIGDLEDDLLDVNSQALIKNLTLQIAALALETQQAELTLRQESIRLGQLYNELAQIERVFNDQSQFVSERYYADPIHYLRMQESVQRAQATFREAQDWTFFAARALEYKWNTRFTRTVGERTWSINELFRTRNSQELAQMMSAMELYDGAQSLGPGTQSNTDTISLREDVLRYRDLDNQGNPLFYADPITGESVRAIEAFQSYLTSNRIFRSNGNIDVSVSLSTAFSPSGSQFFLPPVFDISGSPTSLGTWLNKIQWIKINVPGDHTRSGFVNGFLSDGGTQLIRRRTVGTLDPSMPDRISGDMTAYSSRIYFTADGGESFEFRERLRAPIRLELDFPAGTTTMPAVPENTFFRERSVANTEWSLEFTLFDASGAPGGLNLLKIEEIDDVELVINHRFSPRL